MRTRGGLLLGIYLQIGGALGHPCFFRHHLGILVGNSIGMAMTNGYVCGQGGVVALWRSPAALGQGFVLQ